MQQQDKREKILKVFLCFLSFSSLFVSIYLVYDHFKDDNSSFCDVAATISCTKVRRSVFSELLNVPIAIFGFTFNCINVYGSLVLLLLSILKKKAFYLSGLFYWNVFGCFFVFYLIGAEIYLQSICPLCTVIHILQIIQLIVLYLLHFDNIRIPTLYETILNLKKEILLIIIINIIPIILFNSIIINHESSSQIIDLQADEEFTKCLDSLTWKLFGKSGCSWCLKQLELFSNHRDILTFIDCKHENWKSYCDDLNINVYPTWIQFDLDNNEIQRLKGYTSIESLGDITNCKLK